MLARDIRLFRALGLRPRCGRAHFPLTARRFARSRLLRSLRLADCDTDHIIVFALFGFTDIGHYGFAYVDDFGYSDSYNTSLGAATPSCSPSCRRRAWHYTDIDYKSFTDVVLW